MIIACATNDGGFAISSSDVSAWQVQETTKMARERPTDVTDGPNAQESVPSPSYLVSHRPKYLLSGVLRNPLRSIR